MMIWKTCVGYPAYEVSENGDVQRMIVGVRGHKPGGLLRSYLHKGYRRYGLWQDGKQRHVKAARLVIDAFIGQKPFAGAEICHSDGNKTNDHFLNLRWDSHLGNMADKEAHGTLYRGSRHCLAKLCENEVVEIKKGLASGISHYDLAVSYGVRPNTIRSIKEGRSWRHIGG